MQNPPDRAPPPGPSPRPVAGSNAKYVAFAVVGVAFAGAAAFIAHRWSPGSIARDAADAANTAAGRVADRAGRLGTQLADAFLAENIQRTFSDHITTIEAEKKARLMVASIEAEERMTDTSTKHWGTTRVDVRVPATFRYAVSLKEKWDVRTELTQNGAICRVVAPDIRPVLPVAFDTRQLEVKATTTWLRLDGDERAAEMTREITPFLTKRSGERARQARDSARQAIAEFVRGWLADRGQWGAGKFQHVIVYFPDEVDAAGSPRGDAAPKEKSRSG